MNMLSEVPYTVISTLVGVVIRSFVALFFNYTRKRMTTKADRQKLKEELELAKGLPEASSAREHLQASIEERVIRLSYEKIFNGLINSLVAYILLTVLCGGAFTTAFAVASKPEARGAVIATSTTMWLVALIIIEFILVVGALMDMKIMNRQREEYF
ncbi:hypothetical protein [Mycobacterium sp.]|uniref:hypothetical protein n=1 Tax=Mycobacterium sp. TaxID=1785 RepID=UPI003BA8E987